MKLAVLRLLSVTIISDSIHDKYDVQLHANFLQIHRAGYTLLQPDFYAIMLGSLLLLDFKAV